MGKVNIDNCYLVLISRLREKKDLGENILYRTKKVKFTVVESMQALGANEFYRDVFGDEIYRVDCQEFDDLGTLFINNNWFVLPVSSLIDVHGQYLRKGTLAKIFREPIVELNRLFYSEDRNKILDLNFIHEVIKNSNNAENKQKKLSIRRIKK